MEEYQVVEVRDPGRKSAYAKQILGALPEWFADKQAVDQYAKEAERFPFWAAVKGENACVGFLAARMHYGHTGEIFVCGILAEHQHKGVGKALYQKAEAYFIANGCKYIMVKTLSDVADYAPYEETRKFYESAGFEPLITLTEMWDAENPCLIMLKTLN